MATININASSNDIININVTDSKPQISKEDLYKKVLVDLTKYSKENEKRWWYEVWIDLEESWDGIYEEVKNLSYRAVVDTCIGFLQRMDDYYGSPKWYEDMNEMVKDIKFGE